MNRSSLEHLSSEDLAAYLDGEADRETKARVRTHLADCDECRSEMTELTSSLWSQRRRRTWTVGVPTAAAAAVAALLLVGPFAHRGEDASLNRLRGGNTGELEAVREIPIRNPEPGIAVSPGQVEFSWAEVGADATYRLTLTDEGGDPLWTIETQQSTVALPDDVELDPGQRYLWFVDALLADGTHATTGVESFTVRR